VTGEAERALLGGNPPRNSRLETYSDGREPIGTDRFPPLGGCQATISSSIGVDLPIPQKPKLATARWWPVSQDNFVT
jgi:hypothetical protein